MSFASYLEFRSQLSEVLDDRYYPLEWLDQRVLNGSIKVWACEGAILLTELKEYPTGANDLHALIAAGDKEKIVGELRVAAEEWARKQGCVGILVESRPGWSRALKQHGYETHQLTVRKELNL